MKTTLTKKSTSTSTKQKETFNTLPLLIQKKLQQLWDNASEGNALHKIYLEENQENQVYLDGSFSWNDLIGINLNKTISDYTNTEILAITNKAKKLAYKNDTMTTSKLRKIWVDTIRLEKEFVAKQTRLSGKEYIIMGIKWHDMIEMHKNFNYCSQKEILEMYEKAKWFCDNDNLVRFDCQCCGMSYFYVEESCNNDKDYLKTIWIKNKCHCLKGDKEIGYGSLLDGNRVSINMCDDCLCGMKK